MKTINYEKRAERAKEILEASLSCFYKKGIANTSMRDIAAEVNLSLGNLYRYFKNKDELIIEAIRFYYNYQSHKIDELTYDKNYKKGLVKLLQSHFDEYDASSFALTLEIFSLSHRNKSILLELQSQESRKLLLKSIKKAKTAKIIDLTHEAKMTVDIIQGYVDNLVSQHYLNPSESVSKPKKAISSLIDNLLITP